MSKQETMRFITERAGSSIFYLRARIVGPRGMVKYLETGEYVQIRRRSMPGCRIRGYMDGRISAIHRYTSDNGIPHYDVYVERGCPDGLCDPEGQGALDRPETCPGCEHKGRLLCPSCIPDDVRVRNHETGDAFVTRCTCPGSPWEPFDGTVFAEVSDA